MARIFPPAKARETPAARKNENKKKRILHPSLPPWYQSVVSLNKRRVKLLPETRHFKTLINSTLPRRLRYKSEWQHSMPPLPQLTIRRSNAGRVRRKKPSVVNSMKKKRPLPTRMLNLKRPLA